MNQNGNHVEQEDLKVLGVMLEDPSAWHYSLEVGRVAGVAPGTIYPALAKLEMSGWIESRWDAGGKRDPRRRLYRLTGVGQRCAAAAVADQGASPASRRRRPSLGFPRPQGAHC